RVRDARRAADLLERLEQCVLLDSRLLELRRGLASGLGERQQEVLGRNVLVAELLGDLEGAVEDAGQVTRHGRVGGRARHGRLAAISAERASGLTPSFWSTGTTTPSFCFRSASSRCSLVSSALPRARASRWASWTASWALMVS